MIEIKNFHCYLVRPVMFELALLTTEMGTGCCCGGQLTVVFYRQMVAAVSSSRLHRCSLEAPHRLVGLSGLRTKQQYIFLQFGVKCDQSAFSQTKAS